MPSPPTNPANTVDGWRIFQSLSPIGTWLFVIAGWIFVRNDNNSREDRRDLRKAIDALIESIEDLEQKAFEYYTSEPNSLDGGRLQNQIKRGQDLLEENHRRLGQRFSRFDDVSRFAAFRRALTGGDFESASRIKIPSTDSKLSDISFAAKDLILYLEKAYDDQIPMPGSGGWLKKLFNR